MHTTPTRPNTDTAAAIDRGLVELEDLICPGCGEQVRGAPPERLDGHEVPLFSHLDFSHLDATVLCRTWSGAAAEPIETVR